MGDLAVARPDRGNVFAAGRIAAVKQDHVWIFGEHLVQHGPYPVVVLILRSGSERDAGAYVRPEDEPFAEGQNDGTNGANADVSDGATVTMAGQAAPIGGDDDDDEAIKPLPDRLVSELTAERTLALRDALANAPQAAFLALLHALVLSVFRPHRTHGCVQIGVTQAWLGNVAPNLRESVWSQSIQARHEHWGERLPDEPQALWDALTAMPQDEQMALLAHCVSHGVNALFEPSKGYDGRISAHGVTQRIAAGFLPGELVLEPSAGTGLLAVQAEFAGCRLVGAILHVLYAGRDKPQSSRRCKRGRETRL